MSGNQPLYDILTELLKQARDKQQPITSVECFDNPEVRKHASDVNKVSDTLGHLWRSKFIERFAAPKMPNSQAKFAYAWKPESKEAKRKVVAPHIEDEAPEIATEKHAAEFRRSIAQGATTPAREEWPVHHDEWPQVAMRRAGNAFVVTITSGMHPPIELHILGAQSKSV